MRSMGIFGFLQWFFFVITKSGHEQFCIWLNKKGLGTRVRHLGAHERHLCPSDGLCGTS
jgi:hypothetical protein